MHEKWHFNKQKRKKESDTYAYLEKYLHFDVEYKDSSQEWYVILISLLYVMFSWNWILMPLRKMACIIDAMGPLPNTSNCGCACAGNPGNVFSATAGKQSRHASRHVRDARAMMHAGIANSRFPLNSDAGGNVPSIPGACARGPLNQLIFVELYCRVSICQIFCT